MNNSRLRLLLQRQKFETLITLNFMKKSLLFLSLLFLCFSAKTYAQEPPTTMWNDVATTDWYNETDTEFTLSTAEEFAGLSVLVAGGNDFLDKTILIDADIDLGANLWTPIGVDVDFPFSGTVDGQGHTISNLFINMPDGDFIGLFGQCTYTTLSNINLENTWIRAKDTAGSLAGNFSVSSNMNDCHATGVDMVATSYNIGGLIGGLLTDSHIIRCSSEGSVVGFNQVGGLVGSPWDLTSITECYSTGTVSAEYLAGGLIGYSTFAFGPNRFNTINNCYSRCDVSVVNGRVGGLVGGTDSGLFIYNSYSTGTATGPEFDGGSLGAVGSVTTENNYWDTETSEHDNAIGGWLGDPVAYFISGKTTAEMKTQAMVDSLNQNQDIQPWTIDPEVNDGYPILASMPVTGVQSINIAAIEMSVYPTLVDRQVTIESVEQLTSYTLFDIAGKAVQQESLSGNMSVVNVQSLAPGTYILLVNTQKGAATQKLIKE